MTPLRRRAYLACALCVGTSLCFFLTEILPLPVPIYYPIARRWALGQGALQGVGMDYYGRSLIALLGGALAVLCADLGARLSRRWRAASDGRAASPLLLLCTAWAATALALCASLYAYKLSGRELVPEPLPAWYQPR